MAEDLIAIVTEEPSFWYDPVEIQVGYRIEEGWHFCAGLTVSLALPYRIRGFRLTRVITACNAHGTSRSPLKEAQEREHPFLKFHRGDLVVLPWDATYLREEPSPASSILWSSGGNIYGRQYERTSLECAARELQVEVNEHVIEPLGTATEAVTGAIASEILALVKLEGPAAVVARYFGIQEFPALTAPSVAKPPSGTRPTVPGVSKLVAAIVEHLKRRSLVVFCGAGISMNSGLPDVRSLERFVLSVLGLSSEDAAAFEFGIPFESFVASLGANTDLAPLLDLFSLGRPNRNHLFLAACVKAGLVKTICTTNFDLLLERALGLAGVEYHVYHTDRGLETIDWDTDRVRLIKLHGSIDNRADLGITIQRVAGHVFSESRKAAIDRIFSGEPDQGVLILGYSCSDEFDISEAIRGVRANQKAVYFLEHVGGQREVSSEHIASRRQKNPFGCFTKGLRIFGDTDVFVDQLSSLLPELDHDLFSHTSPREVVEWRKCVEHWAEPLADELRQYTLGWLFKESGDSLAALDYFRQSLAANRHERRNEAAASCLQALAEIYLEQGDYQPAADSYNQALDLYTRSVHQFGMAKCLRGIANIYLMRRQCKESQDYFACAAQLFQEIGDGLGVATCESGYANSLFFSGYPKDAVRCFVRALKVFRDSGEVIEAVGCLNGLGNARSALGEYAGAADDYEQALELSRHVGDLFGLAGGQLNLGNVKGALNQHDEALKCFAAALDAYGAVGDQVGIARCHVGMGTVRRMRGELDTAIECFGKAHAIFENRGLVRDCAEVERTMEQCLARRMELGP